MFLFIAVWVFIACSMASEGAENPPDLAAGPSGNAAEPLGSACSLSRNNAIVFHSRPDFSIHEYIKALAQTMPSDQILSASRISGQRIAVYLNTKQAVHDAVNKGLNFHNSYVQIQPLVLPTTKLTLSNVYPEIPNDVLNTRLSSFCKVVSPVRTIPLGFRESNLSHILSFRRQVQVILPTNVIPPDHLNFNHRGANYRVFISTDSVRCFNCGEFGHTTRVCKKSSAPQQPPKKSIPTSKDERHARMVPTNEGKSVPPTTEGRSVDPNPDRPGTSHDMSPKRDIAPSQDTSLQNDSHTSPKSDDNSQPVSVWGTPPDPGRLFSDVVAKRKQDSVALSDSIPSLVSLDSSATPPRKFKKVSTPTRTVLTTPKTSSVPPSPTPSSPTLSSSTSTQDLTEIVWDESDDDSVDWASSFPSSQGPLSHKTLLQFLKTVKASKKPHDVARKFTSNIPGLVRQLRPLKNSPLFKKSTQQRVHKLINKLDMSA